MIGRITPGGQLTEFPIPILPGASPAHPTEIISGPGGDLWFLDGGNSKLGQVTPAGQISEFSLPGSSFAVGSIAAGADGNLWFTDNPSSFVFNVGAAATGRITPDGQSTLFPLPKTGSASALTAGPNGDIWFLDAPDGKVGSITPEGQITETAEPTPDYASGITTTTDGALWYVADESLSRYALVRLVPGGQAQSIPLTDGASTAMVAGPAGSLVFLDEPAYELKTLPVIDQVSPDGVITHIAISDSGSEDANSLSYGPDGNLWLTGLNSTIDRVDLVPTPPPSPMLVGQGIDAVSPVGEEIELPLADVRFSPDITVTSTTIDWGDGSTSPGTLPGAPSTGSFEFDPNLVGGEHVYSAVGSYNASLTVTGVDSNGQTYSLILPIAMEAVDPTPVPQPTAIVEKAAGIAFTSQVVAQFQTPTPHDVSGSDFTATIDWGDGTPESTATIALDSTNPGANQDRGKNPFSVFGDHTYSAPGVYKFIINVISVDGVTASYTNNILVFSPAVQNARGVSADPSIVATFTTRVPDALPNDFTAVIDSGDGSPPEAGTIQSDGLTSTFAQTNFSVMDNHVYSQSGTYNVSIKITGADGVTVEVMTKVTLSIPTALASGSGSSPGQPSNPASTPAPGNNPTQTPGQSPNLVSSPSTNVPMVGPMPYPLPSFLTRAPGASSIKPTTAIRKPRGHSLSPAHQTKQVIIPSHLKASGKSASLATNHQTHTRIAVHHPGRVLTHAKGTGPKKLATTR